MIVEGLVKELLGGAMGRATLQVVSGSMRPCLQEGDRIEVARSGVSALWPGDLVVFQTESAGIVVHRLIWRESPPGQPMRLYTKGDALESLDRAVAASQVLGRVERILRGERVLAPVSIGDRARCLMRAVRHGFRRLLRRGHLGAGPGPTGTAE